MFLIFTTRKLGKIFTHFDDSNVFQMGWFNHQPGETLLTQPFSHIQVMVHPIFNKV